MLYQLVAARFSVNFVYNLKMFVFQDDQIPKCSLFQPLSDQVHIVFIFVIDNLIEPYDVGVIQLLENFELFSNTVQSSFATAC